MKVKITRGCIANGEAQEEGDTVNVSKNDAQLLVRMGKAEYVGRPPADDQTETETTEAKREEDATAAPARGSGGKFAKRE